MNLKNRVKKLEKSMNIKQSIHDEAIDRFYKRVTLDEYYQVISWLYEWEEEKDDKYKEYEELCAILKDDANMTEMEVRLKALEMLIEKYVRKK